jgi:integrase
MQNTLELPEELPERITPLVKIYRHDELGRFFAACSDTERALFATFLLTGFCEQEVIFLRWSDVNFELRTVRVPAPKGRYRPARYNQVAKHTEPLRMSQRWIRRYEWPRKVAPETIDRRGGQLCRL